MPIPVNFASTSEEKLHMERPNSWSAQISTLKKTDFNIQLTRNSGKESCAMNAMLVFDLCETILITLLLVLTIPFACVIYWKLLVVPPFAENFTFKLIVFNGATVSRKIEKSAILLDE